MSAAVNGCTSGAVTNVVVAGLGGQGVITCSDVLAEAAVEAGFDVKKSEIHGMSQRGGSVSSDVRFGAKVYSPMVSSNEAHFLIVLSESQIPVTKHYLRPDGVLISCLMVPDAGANDRTINTMLLGKLSVYLPISEAVWTAALRKCVPANHLDANLAAFAHGRGL